jgi:AhpD family alkylhydroperoxidase
MQKRISVAEVQPEAVKGLYAISSYLHSSGLDKKLIELIKIRASQINGCAFCIDMHTKDARKMGETEQRIYTLNAWRETPYFTDAERAVLALTECMTEIATKRVPDDVYTEMTRHFSEEQIAQVIMAVVSINAWNRIAISTNMMPPL